MLDSEDVAQILKCSRSQAYRILARIPFHVREGRMIRVPRWAFLDWLEKEVRDG